MRLDFCTPTNGTYSGGKIVDTSFDREEIRRLSWLPKIETIIIGAKDDPPQGGGEPAIIVVGAGAVGVEFASYYHDLGCEVKQLVNLVANARDASASGGSVEIRLGEADEAVRTLMEELASTENRIAFARQAFNDAVTLYNTEREKFPNNLIAGPFNFDEAGLLEATDSAAVSLGVSAGRGRA